MTNKTTQPQYKVTPPNKAQLANMTLLELTSSIASLKQALQVISEYMSKHLKDAGYTPQQSRNDIFYSAPRHTDGHSDINYTPTGAPALFDGRLAIVDSTLEDEFRREVDLSTEEFAEEQERLDLLNSIRSSQQ
ncbi:MAG: hypothetical protein IM507_01720 [Microcystis sp. M20BS1]|uniref:hypothetical protein n=1 Tax=unclassified Microcystis TaxID=2643300 RepID=UPI002579FC76|nr:MULTISPECIES: hypothetical protein [unclassified Microcystis]MCA2624454.1 hypothetical protein [Microcystis sp. M19BS1]MCA2631156.1 hypothetical protein [Microcystis sp. M20BS1]